jgi:hypothetical protein
MRKSIALSSVAACLLLAGGALAQVSYVSGGVGLEERTRIQASAHLYNFQVKAAYTTGHYLADVRIMIHEAASGEEVLNALTEGPFFYAKLPAGTYVVSAAFGDEVQEQRISIAAGNAPMREAIFRFKPAPEPALIAPLPRLEDEAERAFDSNPWID